MKVDVDREGEIAIARPLGKIDASSAADFEEAINAIIRNESRVVIDLVDVPFVSSAGLRVFILAARELGEAGRLAVCRPSPVAREVFELAGFQRILSICDDLESAKAEVS